MNYSDLINGALWAFSGGALIAALLAFHKSLSAVVAGLGGALGSALATLAGALALTHGDSALRFTVAALHFQAQLLSDVPEHQKEAMISWLSTATVDEIVDEFSLSRNQSLPGDAHPGSPDDEKGEK